MKRVGSREGNTSGVGSGVHYRRPWWDDLDGTSVMFIFWTFCLGADLIFTRLCGH